MKTIRTVAVVDWLGDVGASSQAHSVTLAIVTIARSSTRTQLGYTSDLHQTVLSCGAIEKANHHTVLTGWARNVVVTSTKVMA
jgi:hypothetical protein